MSGRALSIVIPVFNKWELTRQCLQSLADTACGDDCEVIVVDNASSDATLSDCAPFGQALFGQRFRLLRQENNRHFAAACNLGAQAARGDWLFLLNNDTIAQPGWRPPLHEAFAADPLLGAVGPLLLYPSAFGFADRVQHLGVFFDPDRKVGHLYEYFPANHAVVSRLRPLQTLTAAALLTPRSLFLDLGGFYEGFVDGYEDIDFCLRLGAGGRRMRLAPTSRLYHLCGQTPGRGAHDAANAALLTERCRDLAQPDLHMHLQGDGYRLSLSPWLNFEPALSRERSFAMGKLPGVDKDEGLLLQAISVEPLWQEGYSRLAALLEARGADAEALSLRLLASQLWQSPDHILPLYRLAKRIEPELARSLSGILRAFISQPDARARKLRQMRGRYRAFSAELAAEADALLSGQQLFMQRDYSVFVQALQQEGICPAGQASQPGKTARTEL